MSTPIPTVVAMLLLFASTNDAVADDDNTELTSPCIRPLIIASRDVRATTPYKDPSDIRRLAFQHLIARGRIDSLRNIYIAAEIPDHCQAKNGEVLVKVRTASGVQRIGEAYIPIADKHDHRTIRTSATLYDAIQATDMDRMTQLREGKLGEAASFDENLIFEWCERSEAWQVKEGANSQTTTELRPTIVACPADGAAPPAGTTKYTSNLSYTAIVGREHEYVSLAVTAQPGRFMGVMVPCSIATSYTSGQIPEACEDGRGSVWGATAAASPIGAKVYFAPSVRYPWLGFSVSISASSIGVNSIVSKLSTEASTDTTNTGGQPTLFTSPFDIALGIADLRVPGDARFDITPQLGLAVLARDGMLRPAPYFGVSITTPLIEVFGARFNGSRSPTVVFSPDHPMYLPLTVSITRAKEAQDDLDALSDWEDADWSASDADEALVDLESALEKVESHAKVLNHELPRSISVQIEQVKVDAGEAMEQLAERREAVSEKVKALEAKRSELEDAAKQERMKEQAQVDQLKKDEEAAATTAARTEVGVADGVTPTSEQQQKIDALKLTILSDARKKEIADKLKASLTLTDDQKKKLGESIKSDLAAAKDALKKLGGAGQKSVDERIQAIEKAYP
jgi:hypothetical protein